MDSQKCMYLKNNLIITFASNTGHKSIGMKVHISIINTFKWPKCALELKLLNLKLL